MNIIYKTHYSSPIGKIMLASDGDNLVGAWIDGQKYFAQSLKDDLVENNNLEVFKFTTDWLNRYFNAKCPHCSELPLAPKGNEFRQFVWQILCDIPYGEVTTYGEIAKEVAKHYGKTKMSAQAVGGAVGHNPISIIIPCHRVVGANGNLTGYAGGINLKIKLLEHEDIDISQFFVPTKSFAP